MWPNQNRPRLSTENLQTKPCHDKYELIMQLECDHNFQKPLKYFQKIIIASESNRFSLFLIEINCLSA